MIDASEECGVAAFRVAGRTGVWVQTGDAAFAPGGPAHSQEKLGAIGVHLSRWVTSHGFAYNVSTDLSYFNLIVPCGLSDCRATSLEKLLRRAVPMADAREHLGPKLSAGHWASPWRFSADISEVGRGCSEPAMETAATAAAE